MRAKTPAQTEAIEVAAALLTAAATYGAAKGRALDTSRMASPRCRGASSRHIALAGGVLLLLGLGTRYFCVVALLGVVGNAMIDPRETDAVYLLMSFSMIIIYGGGAFPSIGRRPC